MFVNLLGMNNHAFDGIGSARVLLAPDTGDDGGDPGADPGGDPPAGDENNPGQGDPPQGGRTEKPWLPTDLREDELFKEMKGAGDLGRAYKDTVEKLKGYDGRIFVPGDDASPEELAQFRTAVGVPESADQYELDIPELPDGMEYNKGLENWFRAEALKNNIPTDAAKELYAAFNEQQIQAYNSYVAAEAEKKEQTKSELKQLWGSNYDREVNFANRGISILSSIPGAEGLTDLLNDEGLLKDIRFVKAFNAISHKILGNGIMGGGELPGPSPYGDDEVIYENTPGMH